MGILAQAIWIKRVPDSWWPHCQLKSSSTPMAEEEGQEVIFTENTAPDREIWDEKGGLIKKGAAEIAERDQDHVPEVKVLTTLGMFAVPVTAETTVGEIR